MYKSALGLRYTGLRYLLCDITAIRSRCREPNTQVRRAAGVAPRGEARIARLKPLLGVTIKMTGSPADSFPSTRLRRMRRDEFSRRLMRETQLSVDALIYPIFVVDRAKQRQPVGSMPGIE